MTIKTGAGHRDKLVMIQQKIETRGTDYSDVQTTWADFRPVYAALEPLSGREYFLNREQQTDVTVRITTDYVQGVTNKMRITYRDKIYQIVSAINLNEQNEELELMCSDFEQTVE